MNFTAITQDILSDNRVQNSEFLKQLCTSTIAMYPNQLPMLPWVGYLAEKNGVFVGTCAYKSSPENGEVEIAYFTFPEYEGQGVATLMAQWLINIANQHGVSCVKAQTLPEKNASVRILERLNFVFVGSVDHPEDGKVWEWRR
jgi:[ribosomal protein S5]-alanine N-acetyltransferase